MGGTGIALSKRAMSDAALLAHVADRMSVTAQQDLFPAFGGQPSALAAWQSDQVNADWGDF